MIVLSIYRGFNDTAVFRWPLAYSPNAPAIAVYRGSMCDCDGLAPSGLAGSYSGITNHRFLAASVLLSQQSASDLDARHCGHVHWFRLFGHLGDIGLFDLQDQARHPVPLDVPGVRPLHHCVRWNSLHGSCHYLDTGLRIFGGGQGTAFASVITAIVLPFTVPRIQELVGQAKFMEETTQRLRASEQRKEALLREVHHRVKNNLAVICSIFYLQSTHTKQRETVDIFRDMENRVHSMALVHESLYSSENLACIDFAEYAQCLAEDILASHETPSVPVNLKLDMGSRNHGRRSRLAMRPDS